MKYICHICHKSIKDKNFRIDTIVLPNGKIDYPKRHMKCKRLRKNVNMVDKKI